MKFDPEQSIIGWILKHNIKTENGVPFDFRSRPFWYDVLTDWSDNIVMLKAAQGGGTTLFLLKMIYAMKKYGVNAAYTMPTAGDVHDLVSGKLNPIINNNLALQELIKDKDSVEQKRIGNNTAYFRGTWVDRTALSFTSGINIHDEEDRSKLPVIEQYSSRQQASPLKMTWRFSNPSVPGHGVHKYWLKSDQKHWFIVCDHCEHKQFLSWPDSIDFERKIFQCKKCHREMIDEVRRRGSWHGIKTLTKPDYSGYWFNLMMAPWTPAQEIIKYSQDKTPDFFHNFVLGLPYAGNGSKLNEHEFFDNLTSATNDQSDPIVIGIDPGLPIWYVIGNKQGLFYQGFCDSWDDIHRLMRRYPKAIAVCDQGGDLYGPRELREAFQGRVYLCWFRQDRKTMRLIEWGRGKESGKVIADRNRVIQQLFDEFRAKRIPLYGSREDWHPMWLHAANMYREMVEDASGNERFVWQRAGADHLILAATYWRIGIDKFQNDGSRYVSGEDIGSQLGVVPSWENNFDDRMPVQLGKPKEVKDWRDLS